MKKNLIVGFIIDPKINVKDDTQIVTDLTLAYRMNLFFYKPSILIIDDENDICFLLSNILKQKDIRPVIASSLSEADNIIANNSAFSLVFLDNHLPDGRGVDYIKQIKEKNPLSKVVMITAHDNQADRETASQQGADFFIGKPFTRESILATLTNFTV